MKTLLILLFFSFTLFSSERLDFNFKDMEFKVVVESIAKLINKNAVFLKGAESGKLVNFKLSNTTPETALKLLMETNGYSSRIKGDILYIAAANDQSGGAADSKITVVVPLTHVIAKDIDAQIKSVAGTALTYTINEQLNAFIVTGNEEAIDGIRKLVIALDKEIAQIFIEAKIIETSKKFSREFGIEWGNPALRSSGGVSVTGASASTTGSAIGGTGINVNKSDITAGISLGLSSTSQLNAKISAAESNGDIKIISNPKISTLNGQTAVIEDSSTFTFRTVTSSGSGTGNITGLGAAGVEKIKAGLKFSVTPFLVSNEKVRFNISISKSRP